MKRWLLAAFLAMPSAWAAPPAYEICAVTLALPTRGDQFVQPRDLTLEQKKLLVACADEKNNNELSTWLFQALSDDIKAGLVPAPGSRPRIEPKPRMVAASDHEE